ncbi:hypothetical protein PGT21_011431, partial [Puccinia graminis f. sp. tritici]
SQANGLISFVKANRFAIAKPIVKGSSSIINSIDLNPQPKLLARLSHKTNEPSSGQSASIHHPRP